MRNSLKATYRGLLRNNPMKVRQQSLKRLFIYRNLLEEKRISESYKKSLRKEVR